MCLLCVEVQKQSMTTQELARAYLEFEIPDGHEDELHSLMENHYDKDEIAEEIAEIEFKDFLKENQS